MVAAACFWHSGRRLAVGQEFEAVNERDASELVLTGVAKRKQADSQTKRRTYKRRDMRAE